LRELEQRLVYLRELTDRKATVLSITEQGKLTPALPTPLPRPPPNRDLEDIYSLLKFKSAAPKANGARPALNRWPTS
jgi:transcriptional accessory protein Tex/SPT6